MNQCPRCLKQFRTVFGDAEMQEIVHTCTPTKEWREMEEATEQSSKEIERLNALVAMQAEALKEIVRNPSVKHIHANSDIGYLESALSASSSTVAKWEAEKQAKWNEESNSLIGQQDVQIESLQRQVAMLHAAAAKYRSQQKQEFPDLELLCDCADNLDETLSTTQATAEAYDREHAAKVLEEAALWFELNYSKICSIEAILDCHAHEHLRRMADERRATKQVKE